MEQDTLNTQLNAENQYNSNSGETTFTQEEIVGTPFRLVTNNKTGESFLTLGQYRLTDKEYTKQELIKIIKGAKNINWEFMIATIGAISNQTIQTYKNEL